MMDHGCIRKATFFVGLQECDIQLNTLLAIMINVYYNLYNQAFHFLISGLLQGLGLRPGVIDGAISISAVQVLACIILYFISFFFWISVKSATYSGPHLEALN